MRSGFLMRAVGGATLCALLCFVAPSKATCQDTSTSDPPALHRAKTKQSKHPTSKRSRKSKKKRGQQVIDAPRAREIQEALIRQHYLDGEPSGRWDAATERALRRYQADQGWQTKTVPDSRALIKLGLGPSTDRLLNPESAMTTQVKPDPKLNPSARAASENRPQP